MRAAFITNISFFGLLLSLVTIATPPEAYAAPGSRILPYNGQMSGPNGQAVSGVFELRFSLHRDAQTEKFVWEESHEIAVVNGKYRIVLGESKTIPRRFALKNMFVAVSLVGGPELLREPVGALIKVTPPTPVPQKERKPAQAGSTVESADRAEFATEAGLSANSDRLEGRTLEQVAEFVVEKVGGRKVRVGKNSQVSATHAGGYGGSEFKLTCPRGYVVVGIQGHAGRYVDGFEVLCAPLLVD
jgi:hypothetical protein